MDDTMYKLYEIIYRNNVTNYTISHVYYVAKSEEDVKTNCKTYHLYCKWLETAMGKIEIKEIKGVENSIYFYDAENLDDFEITLSIKKKGV